MEQTDRPDQPASKPTSHDAVLMFLFGVGCVPLAAGLIIWAWQAYNWLSTGTWLAVTVNGVLSRVELTVPQIGSDRVDWIGDASMAFVLVLLGFALLAAAAAMVGKHDKSD